MTKFNLGSILMIALVSFLSGCIKEENYPIVPEIQLENYISVFDTGQYAVAGILNITFTDGDGDIGLAPNQTYPPYDTAGPYFYNLVITYFEKQQGEFKQIDLNPPFSARIPVLNAQFPGKAIKGLISDTLDLSLKPHVNDTIKFEAFIYDRALHKSNTVTTPEIILKRQ